MQDLIKYVLGIAAKSNVEKRQVGCVIVANDGTIVAEGHNTDPEPAQPMGLHAEESACKEFCAKAVESGSGPFTAYVTHEPCPACAKLLISHGIANVEVVEAFKKFDGDKLRYDLIPPSTTHALAEILTFGARKYAPNNWRKNTELWRYEAALMRHFEAYRSGEILDSESGFPHLHHAITNLSFLIELTRKTEPYSNEK